MAPKKKWIRAPELTENSTKRPKEPENSGLDQGSQGLRIVSYNSFFSDPLPGGLPPPTSGEEGSALHQLEESVSGPSSSNSESRLSAFESGPNTGPLQPSEFAARVANKAAAESPSCAVQSLVPSKQPEVDRRDSVRESDVQKSPAPADLAEIRPSDSAPEQSTRESPEGVTLRTGDNKKRKQISEAEQTPSTADRSEPLSQRRVQELREQHFPPTTPIRPATSSLSGRRVVSENLHLQRFARNKALAQGFSPASQFRRAQQQPSDLHYFRVNDRIGPTEPFASQLRSVLEHKFEAGKLSGAPTNSSAQIARGQFRDDMASAVPRMSGDARRYNSSGTARYENKPPMTQSPQLCKNGPHCRKWKEGTCYYNHDFSTMSANGLSVPKPSFNVESPAFTPQTSKAQPAPVQAPRSLGVSPKLVNANAAMFTPRGSGSVTPATTSHSKVPSGDFVPQQTFQPQQQFQEFVPQSFVHQQQVDSQPQMQPTMNSFPDPFLSSQTMPGLENNGQQSINPYSQQASSTSGQPFYQDTGVYKHPLQYHLYASIGPRRDNLMAYQRTTSDFFIPDDLREDLQRKSEATLQTFANSTLPQNIDGFYHSLVALDTSSQKTATTFGYPSSIYKATSTIDGHVYALRRIEGFRLTSEHAINTKKAWQRVNNASSVRMHDAFTTQAFGDRSLLIVTDYHPMSQTLADRYFGPGRNMGRSNLITPEHEIWSQIVQLASALKSIHTNGLAAQSITASKVLLTSKNRIRLSGCGVLDIINFGQQRSLVELQRADLEDLGRMMLSIAARNPNAPHNPTKALEQISRSYTERLRACIEWLLSPPPLSEGPEKSLLSRESDWYIRTFMTTIADQIMSTFDSTLSYEDELSGNLAKELENGRIARLLAKLNVILERPESSPANSTQNPALLNQASSAWSETGERYYLKLFRDYVFHQVDHEGRPSLDLGHIMTCLNKLDAGIDEKIQLTSRDEQNLFVVTYKEVKRGFESAWSEITKASNPARR